MLLYVYWLQMFELYFFLIKEIYPFNIDEYIDYIILVIC